ncbi:hypothetical protein SAMN04489761_0128 [Tenacibaculum sp. MAR_2009_124]|uniref:hypothetical protein n=1 Tax=Tenacibaculum sp. MAR_2009_124 TaxID=1250059 RepID=UPI0008974CAB|nr:hypothetical protein [Tenacibaculum sp. MAR_2009_124]SEB36158.1 hypothetical protein SAMN04489761_0128 [Tenacibaculum sp. MAR_2009_124]
MKKLFVLTLSLISLLSCNDSDQDIKDPFIGNWYKFSFQGEEVSDCEKKTTFIVEENGDLSISSFEEYENDCIDDGTASGKWSKHDGNYYGITLTGDTSPDLREVIFKDNNNTFSFTDNENGKTFTYTYRRK